jgi:hypothetical protein
LTLAYQTKIGFFLILTERTRRKNKKCEKKSGKYSGKRENLKKSRNGY